tara:strand:+ start:998 stop:1924 length:927 start_codon:yes stop_codon:yes gene_type:complete
MPIGAVSGGGDSGGDDDRKRPDFGLDFGGKGYGGGGIRMMNFGTDWQRNMIGLGNDPANFGLPGDSSDYAPGGRYHPSTTNTFIPGGYEVTGGPTGKSADHIGADERQVRALAINPLDTLEKYANMDMGMDMGMGIGSLSPTAPAPFEPQTGIFGGTFGPKLKNAFPPKLREFLGNLASIHPATMNAAFAFKVAKGYQGAKDKGAFLKKIATGLAMRKMMGNFGLDRTQKALVGTGMSVAQGDQNWQQGVGSLATNAGFGEIMKYFGPKAYQSGGMPAVYALMSAVKMMRQRAQRRVRSGLAGPGGGG